MSGWRQLIITAQWRKMSRIPKSFLLFQTQMIITYYFHCCSDTLQKHPIRNLNDYAQTTTQPSPLTTSHSLPPSRLRMPSCRKNPPAHASSSSTQSTIHFLKNTRLSNPPNFCEQKCVSLQVHIFHHSPSSIQSLQCVKTAPQLVLLGSQFAHLA